MRRTRFTGVPLLAIAVGSGAQACGAEESTAGSAASPDQIAEICAGVPEAEARNPSFLLPGNLAGVRPFMGVYHYIKFTEPELRGADLYLRPTAGMNRPWLNRVISCHMAQVGQVDAAASQMAGDPLLVQPTPSVSVLETEASFVIRVAGQNRSEGAHILREAERLVEPKPAQ